MTSAVGTWWSLFWRFALAFLVLSFVLIPVVNVLLMPMEPNAAIRWRPTAGWWLIGAFFWIVSAASTHFLATVTWGSRLNLSPAQWLSIGRALAGFFLVLGLLNLLVWELASAEAWTKFKLFWPLPMYAVFFGFLSVWLRRELPSAP